MIKLSVHFYADTFRHCEVTVDDALEKYTDAQRRIFITEIIAAWLRKGGITWNTKKNFSWWSHGGNNTDSQGVGIITCKRI